MRIVTNFSNNSAGPATNIKTLRTDNADMVIDFMYTDYIYTGIVPADWKFPPVEQGLNHMTRIVNESTEPTARINLTIEGGGSLFYMFGALVPDIDANPGDIFWASGDGVNYGVEQG